MPDRDSKLNRSAFWVFLVGIVTGLLTPRPKPAPNLGQDQVGTAGSWVDTLKDKIRVRLITDSIADLNRNVADLNQSVTAMNQSVTAMNHSVAKVSRYLSRPWYLNGILWVALLGELALLWQLKLTQDQVKRQGIQIQQHAAQAISQKEDTLIVRRAQLLATIYECAEREPDSMGGQGESRICAPKAHPRARSEAVRAFAEIEHRRDAFLDLTQADLSRLRLSSVDLYMVDLSGSNLSGSNFSGSNLYMADLTGADLREADLSAANLFEAEFDGADLSGADLSEAMLSGTKFHFANLRGTNLSEADLSGTNLYMADLSGANLRGANLSGSTFVSPGPDPNKTGIVYMEVAYTDLSEAHNLTQDQIDSAKGDSDTKLPEGLMRPEEWLSSDSTLDPDSAQGRTPLRR